MYTLSILLSTPQIYLYIFEKIFMLNKKSIYTLY